MQIKDFLRQAKASASQGITGNRKRFRDALERAKQRDGFAAFLAALHSEWFALMSGWASVPFAFASVEADNKYGQLIFAVMAIVCVWLAGWRVWRIERKKAIDLELRLAPKISAFLEDGGIRRSRGWYPPTSEGKFVEGPSSKWIQVTVTSATDAPLVNCEARLTRVERLNETETTIFAEPMPCTWSNMAPDVTKIDIPAGVQHSANLLSVEDTPKPALMPRIHPSKLELLDEIQKPGTYRLRLAISATGCSTAHMKLLLDWRGVYNDITIALEEGG